MGVFSAINLMQIDLPAKADDIYTTPSSKQVEGEQNFIWNYQNNSVKNNVFQEGLRSGIDPTASFDFGTPGSSGNDMYSVQQTQNQALQVPFQQGIFPQKLQQNSHGLHNQSSFPGSRPWGSSDSTKESQAAQLAQSFAQPYSGSENQIRQNVFEQQQQQLQLKLQQQQELERKKIQEIEELKNEINRKEKLKKIASIERPVYASLSEFEMKVTLGTGTFGRVKLAKHKTSGAFHALKIMKKSEIIKLKQVEHTLNEKNLMAKINHPNIIHLYTTFQDRRNLYMLMEYAPGGEIFSHLRRAGKFPVATAKFYTASLVLAFEHMHEMDIVYRDLKPENLLLDKNGTIKITDFGFAKVVPDRSWTLCGTPEYLAPEIIQSKGHGKPVDWWALGVLVYEMLVGEPPFSDDNPFKIYQKILAGRITFSKNFDVDARDFIRKLCNANPTKRLGSNGAGELKRHPWLESFDFASLEAGKMKAPIIPKVSSDGDTKNFNSYPEREEPGVEIEERTDKELFSKF